MTRLPIPPKTWLFTSDGQISDRFYTWLQGLGGNTDNSGGGGGDPTPGVIPVYTADPQYHVTTSGNDSTGDGSSGATFRTIQHALDLILAHDWNGLSPTINVGAGSFDAIKAAGYARGGTYGSDAPNRVYIIGAGETSTTITTTGSDADTPVAVALSSGIVVALSALAIDVPANCNGINCNTNATVILGGDDAVGFIGHDTTSVGVFADAGAFVFRAGDINVRGTMGTVFQGYYVSNFEMGPGNLNIYADIGTLFAGSGMSNLHDLSPLNAVVQSGGSAVGPAYTLEGGATFEPGQSLFPGLFDSPGIVHTGGVSIGACDDPSISATTGLGSGGGATVAGGSSRSMVITLNAHSGASASGTVTLRANELALLADESDVAPYVFSFRGGSGSWAAGAALQVIDDGQNGSNQRETTISWSNGGTSLANGKSYLINVQCIP